MRQEFQVSIAVPPIDTSPHLTIIDDVSINDGQLLSNASQANCSGYRSLIFEASFNNYWPHSLVKLDPLFTIGYKAVIGSLT